MSLLRRGSSWEDEDSDEDGSRARMRLPGLMVRLR